MIKYIQLNYVRLAFFGITLLASYTIASFLVAERYTKYIYDLQSPQTAQMDAYMNVGIVFGGGISDQKPKPLLQKRLDTAYSLLSDGHVDKLILSGDNRSLDYNEPQAMYNYLVDQKQVNPDNLQLDFAGRSTYETCERASKIFSLDKAYLISESIHLSRAIYLCRHFGIEAFGIASPSTPDGGEYWREILARDKAVFNSLLIGERTVLGEKIDL